MQNTTGGLRYRTLFPHPVYNEHACTKQSHGSRREQNSFFLKSVARLGERRPAQISQFNSTCCVVNGNQSLTTDLSDVHSCHIVTEPRQPLTTHQPVCGLYSFTLIIRTHTDRINRPTFTQTHTFGHNFLGGEQIICLGELLRLA